MSAAINKTLGGIVLPPGLQWPQAGHALGRGTVARLDLAGRPWVWTAPALRRVTLVSLEDMGWLPTATVRALLDLAATGAQATLVWEDAQVCVAMRVAFDHEQGPAVAMGEVSPGSGWWLGSISLIVLEDF